MKYDDAFNALSSIPPSRWNWHEKALCRRIGITATSDATSVHNELNSFVQAYENVDGRGIGDKRRGSKDTPSTNFTFHDIDVMYCKHGKREEFALPKLGTGRHMKHVSVQPRWFQIGDDTVTITRQLAMTRELKGDDRHLDV
jgi:hypothetical protein